MASVKSVQAAGVSTKGLVDLSDGKYSNAELLKVDSNYIPVVPQEDPLYVPFGNYHDIAAITESGEFFPYWIFGLSGNGKTYSIEQSHARLKKKLVLVQITREADEDSLLGGLRMKDGTTTPFLGPVTIAALNGCTVCLDEVDLGDEKIMCLQTALQNRPFFIKRLGKMIYPQPGFNICATANTKGQGSDDGKFIGTNIMNEAMLDRFNTVFEQEYPSLEVERQILHTYLKSVDLLTVKEEQFVSRLLKWAEKVRITYAEDGISDVITTRRLVQVAKSYRMFGRNRLKAIERGISRFNRETKTAMLDFYKGIDATQTAEDIEAERVAAAKAKGLDPGTGW